MENNEENQQEVISGAMEVVDPILLNEFLLNVDVGLINEVLSLIAWWLYWGVPLVLVIIMMYIVVREFLYTKL